MAIKQQLLYVPGEGAGDFINFSDWVDNLPDAERNEFKAAQSAYGNMEEAMIRSGRLTVEYTPSKTYVWASDADAAIGILHNANWNKYHDRYLAENNLTFEVKTETV